MGEARDRARILLAFAVIAGGAVLVALVVAYLARLALS